jgi:hypothetical protein
MRKDGTNRTGAVVMVIVAVTMVAKLVYIVAI